MLTKEKEAKVKLKKSKRLTKILFLVYMILLIWIVMMKTEFSVDNLYRMRSLNLIPLEGTAVRNQQIDYQEIYLNVLVFLPLGIYLSLLKKEWSFIKKIGQIFMLSFLFESLQYLLKIGASDITDLIANTLGGIMGIMAFWMVSKIVKDPLKRNRFFNLLASLVTILFISFYFLFLH